MQLFRLLILALAFEFSGTSAAFAQEAQCAPLEASDCPLEREGKQCPPGCPQCHCAHLGVTVPVIAALYVRAPALGHRLGLAPPDASTTVPPFGASLYRPPRG